MAVEPDEWPRLDALLDDPALDWTRFYQDIVRIADDEAACDRAKWDSDWLLTLVSIMDGVLRGEDRCGGLSLYYAKLVDIARSLSRPDPFEIARNGVRLLFAGVEALREINVRRDRHVGARFVLSRFGVAAHAPHARRIVLARLSWDFTRLLARREAPGGRSTDRQIIDQVVDAEIIETTARRLDKAGLTPRAAFISALDGELNCLPAAVRSALLSTGRRAGVRERDVRLAPKGSDHDEIEAENRAVLDWLGQAEHPKLRALADVLTSDDPPLTLGDAAARVGITRQWLEKLLNKLRAI